MNVVASTVPAASPNTALNLDEMQLCVARRADELAGRHGGTREADRRVWLRAEFEVFERAERVAACCIPSSVTGG